MAADVTPEKGRSTRRHVRVQYSTEAESEGLTLEWAAERPFRMCMFVPIDAYFVPYLRRPSRLPTSVLQLQPFIVFLLFS